MGQSFDERTTMGATVEDLSRIVEHSLNEIYVFGLDTLRFLDVNRPARDNLGYSAAELERLTPLDLKPEFTREQFTSLIAPLRADIQERISFETVHRRRDGSTYPVEVHLQSGHYSGTRVATAIILDITERIRAQAAREIMEQQIQQTQKMESMGILAGGIAHDFNNILTSILGFADLAMEDIDGAHPPRAHTAELVKGARRGAEAFRQMRQINSRVPTLLCSGHNEQTAVNRFAGKGLAGFIQKPYSYHSLCATVKEVVEPVDLTLLLSASSQVADRLAFRGHRNLASSKCLAR